MRTRTLTGGGVLAVAALTLTGCSDPYPEVEGIEADGLIAACLDGIETIAAESNMDVEGTVQSVSVYDDGDGPEPHVVFDATDSRGQPDPAACKFIVADGEVTDFWVGMTKNSEGETVGDAADRWNEEHAEDWAGGDGPEPVEAPEPETS